MLAEVGETRRRLTQPRESLSARRESAAAALATARADFVGIEREASALTRDRAARDQAAARAGRRQTALGGTRVAPGYERALAAALGRDAAAPLGAPTTATTKPTAPMTRDGGSTTKHAVRIVPQARDAAPHAIRDVKAAAMDGRYGAPRRAWGCCKVVHRKALDRITAQPSW
jgi:hypothetical protein